MGASEQVIIIGGGLAGVSTLYTLARRGVDAVLFDQADDIASGASFANGGMLTPSGADPWNGPGVAGALFKSLFDPDAPIRVKPGAVPALLGWGAKFIAASNAERHREATLRNYQLAAYSAECIRHAIDEHNLRCDFQSNGALKIFDDQKAADHALDVSHALTGPGLRLEVLDAKRAIALEPQLAGRERSIEAAVFYPDDGVGDARAFCEGLLARARDYGATVDMNCSVRRIVVEAGRVIGVETDRGVTPARRVIVAAGTDSVRLVRPLGVSLPVQPAKGYSLTYDMTGWNDRPLRPVIDEARHIAISPIGDKLRILGMAELVGEDRRIDPRRVDILRRRFQMIYPALAEKADHDGAKAWTGLRPMSADGSPFIGAAGPEGLWINSGHGPLGWTMSLGSAELLVAQMLNEAPQIDPYPYRINR